MLNRLQAVRTHGACNTVSGPMVTQPIPDVQAWVRTPVCRILAPPPALAPKWADWGSNRRPPERRSAALPLGHYLDSSEGLPCCLGPYLLLTKNPNCVYLSDCLLAGSGTDWLTVNLSSRCTAEGNRIKLCHIALVRTTMQGSILQHTKQQDSLWHALQRTAPNVDVQGGGDFATGIFRCGKFRTSNVFEISRSVLRPLCEINSSRNLATLARHHPAGASSIHQ